MKKKIVFRVHFTKLTKTLSDLVEIIVKNKSQEKLDLRKELKIENQVSALLYAIHSEALKEYARIKIKGLRAIKESLLREVLVDDKTEILLSNMSLTDVDFDDPNGYFISFTFS